MKVAYKLLIPLGLMVVAMSGCVVAPVGYHRGYYHGYYGPGVVVAPAPIIVVRP
jgi:hypothetical protein